MSLIFWTSIKRWWRNHKWVDVSNNYVIPHKNKVFWLNDNEMRMLRKYEEDYSPRFINYLFSPNGIGVGLAIKGEPNRPQLDITDYSAW